MYIESPAGTACACVFAYFPKSVKKAAAAQTIDPNVLPLSPLSLCLLSLDRSAVCQHRGGRLPLRPAGAALPRARSAHPRLHQGSRTGGRGLVGVAWWALPVCPVLQAEFSIDCLAGIYCHTGTLSIIYYNI